MNRSLAAGLVVLICVSATRADWPQFRGPTAQGHAEGKLPTEWAADKNVVWKVPVAGKGWSSPVVVGGRIYLTTAVPSSDAKDADQSLRATAIDAKSGSSLWDVEVFKQDGKTAPKIHGKNSHASATPFVDGDRIYVHFGHQGIACLKTADGSAIWTNRDLKYVPVHGNGGSPLVYEDKVIVCMDGPDRREVVAFDKMTGKIAWQFKRTQPAKRAFSFGTPLAITVNGTPMIVAAGSDVVNGLDPKTGKELWAVTYDGYSVVPRPVFGHGLLFLSTGYDTANLLAIKIEAAGAGFKGEIAWRTAKHAPHNPSPLIVGDELYTVSDKGMATCYDAKTGKIHWQESVTETFSSSPIFAGGFIYLQTETGTGIVLKASKEFEIVSKNKLEGKSLASYAVDGDALLIRLEKELFRIAAK